jgi:hypothetical protein
VANDIDSCAKTIVCAVCVHGRTTHFDNGEIISVSTARLLCFLVVQLSRLAIAVALAYGGSYFIAHEISLGDLILNCVALEVVSRPPRKDAPILRSGMSCVLLRAVSSS